ncbi:hypothetical protein GCM10011415_05890 [Salipiger pallidus]|uniref:Uncharacterized protein n=2 Tax=Salipiger pallidus TaxID=1775170 RepID=A0A8J3EF19_9RHOB|nr:hypothetical protein GCM10011415_05890 [Salipiger pallidus]
MTLKMHGSPASAKGKQGLTGGAARQKLLCLLEEALVEEE